MNILSCVIVLLVVVWIFVAVQYMSKKDGGGVSGCSGNCSECASHCAEQNTEDVQKKTVIDQAVEKNDQNVR